MTSLGPWGEQQGSCGSAVGTLTPANVLPWGEALRPHKLPPKDEGLQTSGGTTSLSAEGQGASILTL